jgi:sulfur carrier protein ThiS
MEVLFLNSEGEGFAKREEMEPGATIAQFVQSKMERSPENYIIRVNNNPVEADYVLQEGDKVTVTPKNIEGA